MYAMKPADKRELAEYRALGTVEELKARLTRPLPDDDGLAPLPMSDPAELSAQMYGDAWDDREHTGLLDEDA